MNRSLKRKGDISPAFAEVNPWKFSFLNRSEARDFRQWKSILSCSIGGARSNQNLYPFSKHFYSYLHSYPLKNQPFFSIQKANIAFSRACQASKQDREGNYRPFRVYSASGDSRSDVHIEGAKVYIKCPIRRKFSHKRTRTKIIGLS